MSLDLSRTITFGRYLPGESPLHRMHAGYKIACWLVYAVALFVAGGFVLLVVLPGVRRAGRGDAAEAETATVSGFKYHGLATRPSIDE